MEGDVFIYSFCLPVEKRAWGQRPRFAAHYGSHCDSVVWCIHPANLDVFGNITLWVGGLVWWWFLCQSISVWPMLEDTTSSQGLGLAFLELLFCLQPNKYQIPMTFIPNLIILSHGIKTL